MTGQENRQRELLKQLKRKADQSTTAHAWLRDRYQLINSVVTTFSLVAGVFLLALIMASPSLMEASLGINQNQYQWLTAFMAAGSFSIVVVLLAWRPDAKATSHDQAVRHYTKAAYQASSLLQREEPPTEEEVRKIQSEYLDNRDLPRIPERKFLKLKQWHLLKVSMSRSLDDNPGESLRSIRQQLRNRLPDPRDETETSPTQKPIK